MGSKSITVCTKKNTTGKQKRGGDFGDPQKKLARKNIGKEKSGNRNGDPKLCPAKNKTAKYKNADAILRIPMNFLPQIVRKIKRGDAAARHCAIALPCASRDS